MLVKISRQVTLKSDQLQSDKKPEQPIGTAVKIIKKITVKNEDKGYLVEEIFCGVTFLFNPITLKIYDFERNEMGYIDEDNVLNWNSSI